ncbi:unnamed protein product [Moritella viscosa]|uniref:Uncharacterized protein n=1 Tax=Moritella viscosa TaxID=80854 RepID=A0A1K9ZPI7_9GAMM|nr:unnamed protein product [Moritella viscosa]SGY95715.1 unnamed protein product [Moritella viscosa]SGZ00303.1 unnamed protein product [Moritella viscosa]SGZ00855.1 unnamed protein product [Moritella viscosa]SHO06250.1 unnamed protein product [Moritella viscosa]
MLFSIQHFIPELININRPQYLISVNILVGLIIAFKMK